LTRNLYAVPRSDVLFEFASCQFDKLDSEKFYLIPFPRQTAFLPNGSGPLLAISHQASAVGHRRCLGHPGILVAVTVAVVMFIAFHFPLDILAAISLCCGIMLWLP